jgi:hypothetical protein
LCNAVRGLWWRSYENVKACFSGITSFNITGIIHFEFVPQVQTVDQIYYVEIMKQLDEAVSRKKPELWPNDWILHRANATAHEALSVKQFLAQKSITETEHSPLSLFWLHMTSGCFLKQSLP